VAFDGEGTICGLEKEVERKMSKDFVKLLQKKAVTSEKIWETICRLKLTHEVLTHKPDYDSYVTPKLKWVRLDDVAELLKDYVVISRDKLQNMLHELEQFNWDKVNAVGIKILKELLKR